MQSAPIVINGWFLQFPFTGIGQYTINVLREFSRSEEFSSGHVDFTVVVPDQLCVRLMQEEKISMPTVVVPPLSWGGASIQKHVWEQIQFPKFCRDRDAGSVWLPYPCVRWLGAQPYRTIVTVHDVIPWTMSEYSTGFLSRLAHAMSRHSLIRADDIITVSEASAREISSACYVPRERIHVVHNGVAETFFHPADSSILESTLAEFGLTRGEYFLYVGGYDARKGVGKLVTSYQSSEMAGSSAVKHPLVLVGGKSHESELYREFDMEQATTAPSTIIRTGFLSEEKLNALYDGARAFVHLSEAEGFNIPLAQALVKGLPCAVSDIPVHHEIAGDTPLYVNPEDPQALATMWQHLETLPTRDSRTITASTPATTAANFSWTTSARAHLSLLM